MADLKHSKKPKHHVCKLFIMCKFKFRSQYKTIYNFATKLIAWRYLRSQHSILTQHFSRFSCLRDMHLYA